MLSLRYRYVCYSNYMKNIDMKNVILLDFESFVNSNEMRLNILNIFSLGGKMLATPRFNAKSSEKNIGIFNNLNFNYVKNLIVRVLGRIILNRQYSQLLKHINIL